MQFLIKTGVFVGVTPCGRPLVEAEYHMEHSLQLVPII
jgi:hypothetical protein